VGARYPRFRTAATGAVLFATLATTVLLGIEAARAARTQRLTAERVLRDYAAFAAWEFERTARVALAEAIGRDLQRVHESLDRGSLHQGRMRAVLVSSPEAEMLVAGDLPPAVRDLWEAKWGEAPSRKEHSHRAAFELIPDHGLLAWQPAAHHGTQILVGFLAEESYLSSTLDTFLAKAALLPPSLARDRPSTELLALRVTHAGREVYRSGSDWSPYETAGTLGPDAGNLRFAVALSSSAAPGLIIGGLPSNRLPLILGLLALSIGLIAVATVQWRRERELTRLRTEFVAGVSHELRTPLAQIRMFTETLLLGRVRSHAEEQRSLEIIARESARLANLVDSVLLFA